MLSISTWVNVDKVMTKDNKIYTSDPKIIITIVILMIFTDWCSGCHMTSKILYKTRFWFPSPFRSPRQGSWKHWWIYLINNTLCTKHKIWHLPLCFQQYHVSPMYLPLFTEFINHYAFFTSIVWHPPPMIIGKTRISTIILDSYFLL